jgi:hypothetical protein
VLLSVVPPYKIKHWDRVIMTPMQSHQLLDGCMKQLQFNHIDVKSCLWNTCRQHGSIIQIPLLNDDYCTFRLECFRNIDSKHCSEWGIIDMKLTKVYMHDYHEIDDNEIKESWSCFKHTEQELKYVKLELIDNSA